MSVQSRLVVQIHDDIDSEYLSLVGPLQGRCFGSEVVQYFPASTGYVAMDGDEPVALAVFTSDPVPYLPDRPRRSAYLYNVCTDPRYRGQRIQERLLRFAFSDLRTRTRAPLDVYLLVLVNNSSAIRLYQRMGFTRLARLTENVPGNEPADLMHLRV